ncbi:MAG: hypothetical protein GXO07_06340 [Crenarchaeota archaeon]|nr:hypothetical protein [Thermoproteota archaeon]
MSCKALLTHAEADVGGTSLYSLVLCPSGGTEARAPRMVADAVQKSKRHEVQLVRRLEGDATAVSYEDGRFKFRCKRRCSFIVKVWAQTGVPVFPFLTDVDVVKNSSNVMSFRVKAVDVRDRGGVLVLKRVGTSRVVDLRDLRPLINVPVVLAEPPVAPRRSVFAYFPDGTLYFYGLNRKELIMRSREIKMIAPFFYGLMIAVAERQSVKLLVRRAGGWEEVEEVEGRPHKIEWGYAWESPVLALHYRDRVVLKSVRGEVINVALPDVRASSISPDARHLIKASPDSVQVINLEHGEVVKEFPISGVQIVEWSFYSDFAALCSDRACWIYSDLSKEIVVVKPVTEVTGAWWSPSTYNLYLARGSKISVVSFDPRGIRGLLPVARRPTLQETP